MAEFLSQITSVSSGSSDEDYDRRIRDLITYLQQPSRASELSAASGYLLDVSRGILKKLQGGDGNRYSLPPSGAEISLAYNLHYAFTEPRSLSTHTVLPINLTA